MGAPLYFPHVAIVMCPPETLNIGPGERNLDDNDLVQLLKNVPSLVELVIRGSLSTVLAGSAVGGLTCRDTDIWIGPNLKVLDVECGSSSFDCGALAKMIQSRRRIDDRGGKAGVLSCAMSEEERVPARLERVHLRINPSWDGAQLLPQKFEGPRSGYCCGIQTQQAVTISSSGLPLLGRVPVLEGYRYNYI